METVISGRIPLSVGIQLQPPVTLSRTMQMPDEILEDSNSST